VGPDCHSNTVCFCGSHSVHACPAAGQALTLSRLNVGPRKRRKQQQSPCRAPAEPLQSLVPCLTKAYTNQVGCACKRTPPPPACYHASITQGWAYDCSSTESQAASTPHCGAGVPAHDSAICASSQPPTSCCPTQYQGLTQGTHPAWPRSMRSGMACSGCQQAAQHAATTCTCSRCAWQRIASSAERPSLVALHPSRPCHHYTINSWLETSHTHGC
jgi:hypothetical protein